MSELAELRTSLNQSIEVAFEKLVALQLDWENPKNQLTVGCYATCVELAQTIDLLSDEEKYFDAKILLRALLEHFVELRNLEINPKHIHNIHAKHADEIAKKLRSAATENKFFHGFAERLDLRKESENWKQKKEDISKLGGESLRIFNRFESAGMKDEYKSVYGNLSELAHATYGGIIQRHLRYDELSEKVGFVSLRVAPMETKIVVVSYTNDLLTEATNCISRILDRTAETS